MTPQFGPKTARSSGKGEKDKAITWFDKAVVWTGKNAPNDPDVARFQTEAAHLLGRPAQAGADAPRLPQPARPLVRPVRSNAPCSISASRPRSVAPLRSHIVQHHRPFDSELPKMSRLGSL